ncbi:MAG: helix-turn-helix domain-containing protein [Clostridiales bacterium]|nr:helix-turn-helix domain-containing protein [Clostridiales bacterium]
MIDEYIEKDILRQIKVTEYLFELKQLNIPKVAELLNVSRMTIKRDIEKILLLDSRIQLVEEKPTHVTVYFQAGMTRYELIRNLYSQSYFLKICLLYLQGERNYIKISEQEHISVAKVFSLKKKVEEFFKKTGGMTEEGTFITDEFHYRLLLLTIWMRVEPMEIKMDPRIYREAQQIVAQISQIFSNELNGREKYFFTLNVYLSLQRKHTGIKNPKQGMAYLYKELEFEKIETIVRPYQLPKNESDYLTIIYRLLNHNLNNYHYLQMDYYQMRKSHFYKRPEILDLVHRFEQTFQRELMKEILFERALVRFLVDIFYHRPMYLVEKNHFIEASQKQLCVQVKQLMSEWSQEYGYKVYLEERAIESFCLKVSDVLIHQEIGKVWHVFIVAESEFSHTIYREWIQRRLNTTQIVIDNELYYDLEALPVYLDTENSVILCERTLTNVPFDTYQETKLFPVSLCSVNEDLQQFFMYVFNQ